MNNRRIGLDLAKNVFHMIDTDHQGKPVKRKKLSRKQLTTYFGNHEPTHIAMEACGSAHYWARQFESYGHTVSLLPAQHVKAYLRGQKNDYNDALAIAEASHHNAIRSVPIKTIEQQDNQALHRIRQLRIKEQRSLANQLRGLLSEYGITLPQGACHIRKQIPWVLADAENGLTMLFRELLNREYQRFVYLDEEINWFNQQLEGQSKNDDICKRLIALPDFGPVVSSAVKGWMGTGKQFSRGRDASSALGLVPRQYTSGDKIKLSGITKRGDKYTRSLVVHGARAVVRNAHKKDDPLNRWITRLVATRGYNKAAIALANKLIRMAWVIIARNEHYIAKGNPMAA